MATISGPMRWTYPDTASSEPEPSRDQTLTGHLKLVDATGITPPEEWTALRARLGELQTAVSGPSVPLQRLIAAAVDGEPPAADIAGLLAAASVKIDPAVAETVHAHVHARLRELWGPVARRNYTQLAGQFNSVARRFADCARTIDPELDAEGAIRAHPNLQAAWNTAPELAAELDSQLSRLAAACELCRPLDAPRSLGGNDATMLIPLCVSIGGLHRRRLWEAWHQLSEEQPPPGAMTLQGANQPRQHPLETRCGRWGLLRALGATIEANPNPAMMELFPPPRPFGSRQVERPGTAINPRAPTWQVFDPEDVEPESGALKRLVNAVAGHHITEEVLDAQDD